MPLCQTRNIAGAEIIAAIRAVAVPQHHAGILRVQTIFCGRPAVGIAEDLSGGKNGCAKRVRPSEQTAQSRGDGPEEQRKSRLRWTGACVMPGGWQEAGSFYSHVFQAHSLIELTRNGESSRLTVVDTTPSNKRADYMLMKRLGTFVLMTAAAMSALAGTVNFDDLKTGAAPPGWTATRTGKGEAKWTVEKDDSAPSKPNVLKQSGEATYPVCLKNDSSLKDGFVEVKFKPISGKEDQAGGVVWRARGFGQLLRRACQCPGRQRDHLPHGQRQTDGEEKDGDESGVQPVAHLAGGFSGEPLHGDL